MDLDDAYARMTATQIAELVVGGHISALEVLEAALRRHARVDGTVRAFREMWPQRARQAAEAVQRAVTAGVSLPLAGVPIGLKAWDGADSPQARRLIAAGCVPLGLTSVPGRGTAWQTWGETPHGPTTNPWRADRSPGGSSAGSAAAVASGIVPLATGTDGAGSIRIPAAWCGVVGVKPTAGTVPGDRPGGLRVSGPLARSVCDAAVYLDTVLDTTNLATAVRIPITETVRAAWSTDLGFADVDPEVAEVAHEAALQLAASGVISLALTRLRLRDPAPAWPVLRTVERRQTNATDVRHAALPPRSEEHAAAEALRRDNDRRLRAFFDTNDVLLTPTTPTGPHGHDGPGDTMSVALTWAFNLSGHPAVTIPAGLTADRVPVGLHIVGRHGSEPLLLRLAATFERDHTWPALSLIDGSSPFGGAHRAG